MRPRPSKIWGARRNPGQATSRITCDRVRAPQVPTLTSAHDIDDELILAGVRVLRGHGKLIGIAQRQLVVQREHRAPDAPGRAGRRPPIEAEHSSATVSGNRGGGLRASAACVVSSEATGQVSHAPDRDDEEPGQLRKIAARGTAPVTRTARRCAAPRSDLQDHALSSHS